MQIQQILENGAIPKTGRGRRHSVQATTLNKDMERLNIKKTKDGEEDKQTSTENNNQRKQEMSRSFNKTKSKTQGKGSLKEIK